MIEQTEKPELLHYGSLPVALIAQPVAGVAWNADVSELWRKLAMTPLLPVLGAKRKLLGTIHEQEVLLTPEVQLAALKERADSANDLPKEVLFAQDTIAQVISRFEETTLPLIPIVDRQGRYTGQCASRARLYQLLHGQLKPARIGGLATPLGVYMTSGYYSAGAGWKGLIATGVLFGVLAHALDWLGLVLYSALLTVFPIIVRWGEGQQMILQTGAVFVCLLAMLRLSPISGLHAAEHMTINAMERDLDLTEPMIRTQPREHVRCGTNLMVFLGGLQVLGLSAYYAWGKMNPLGLLLYAGLWVFLLFKFWKPAGLWLQRYFTTKTPTSAQLASGIKAGEELLEKFRQKPHPVPSLARRIWGSGLVHMAVSFLMTVWVVDMALRALGWS